MGEIQISGAPKEFAEAINAGFITDDDENDVRETGVIKYYDTGAYPPGGLVYRLWQLDGQEGRQIEVRDDGSVGMCAIDSEGNEVEGEYHRQRG